MRISELFTKTRREPPKDEESKNAKLLTQGGFIHKEMAGVYSYLPLGLRVLDKIADIIREEMNAIGGQEVLLTVLQNKEPWEKTGRWSDDEVTDWFKTSLKNGSELGLGLTHEEPLAVIMRDNIDSYKDLPKYVYQIQTKFRNELRVKSGIMRGREFLMKDLYSFNKDEKEQDEFYEKIKIAYMNIFNRCGIGEQTFLTFASGGIFSKYSHEFQTISEAGEDTIYVSYDKRIAVNKDVYTDEVLDNLDIEERDLKKVRSIEVGNIFKLGTKYSQALGLGFTDKDGERKPVVMGSYGIGLGRLMGVIVEVLADDKGIVWPESVAPFKAHLIALDGSYEEADSLYKTLLEKGTHVLYDDRKKETAGEKFADADLIGCPFRLVLSRASLKDRNVEVKRRTSAEKEIELIGLDRAVEAIEKL